MTASSTPTAGVEETIRSLEDARYEAVIAGDLEAFTALAHPELAYTHSNAVVDTRDSYLDKLRAGFYVYHRIEHPVDRIVVTGDTAVVVGEMHADLTAGGVRKTLANRSLAVWVRESDRWLLLAYQPTVLPQEA
ncbi:nuclear transport factor 2 family protein [Streptomyces endophyticus]|uniref:Nuclear transport factor 2 family protein n=1 Tax=Streptomyces endophyticus TaxID=714166 RepID=A0ABU6F822_9ACTN|nr:nuclear transport factor 2 family protein [Streptomyces endophyticus]MEB8340179.1 nuclear transport factor 2 family protein [Streptomyces endophyticus]